MNNFTHLHLHTKFSLQDGTTEPELLMQKCNDHGMRSVGVTDHGNMAGIYDCAKYADKMGINFIPGNEFYVVPDIYKCRGADWGKGTSAHLCLLAMDNKGWSNLLALTYRSNKEGYYHQPRIDYKLLREHHEGLWCLTGCVGGVVAKEFRKSGSARLIVDLLYDIFGDRLSLEIQVNGLQEQDDLNSELIKIYRETSIPLVGTVDAHYLDKSDSFRQDVLFALQLNRTLDDPTRHKLPPEEHSVETPDEALARFTNAYGAIGKKACARTVEIAENSNVKIEYQSRNYKIPTLDLAAQPKFSEFLQWIDDCSCHRVEGKCLIHKDCEEH